AYAADLKARGGLIANADRIRFHLPSALAAKAVSLLTARELLRWRDGLVHKIKPASINRLMKGFKAACALAQRLAPARITKPQAWRTGLAGLPDAHNARRAILSNVEVLAIVKASYGEDHALRLFPQTPSLTAPPPSPLPPLEIADLQDDRADRPRLLIPSS